MTQDHQGKEVTTSASSTPKPIVAPALSEQVVEGKRVATDQIAASATDTDVDDKSTEGKDDDSSSSDDEGEGKRGKTTETPADSDEGDDSTSGEDGTAEEQPAQRARGGFQKRIDKLTGVIHEQQRQLDTALKALQQATGASARQKQADMDREDPKPARDTYEDPEKYAEDLASWSGRQGARVALAEREATERDAAAATALQSAQESYAKMVETGREKYEDWSDVAENNDVKISNLMAYAITRSKVGHDIQYYLGKHPQEAKRITAMKDAADQLLEIGRIEALVKGQTRQVSKAPRPPNPVGARNNAASKPREEMSMDEYAASRQPELDAERRGRGKGSRTH